MPFTRPLAGVTAVTLLVLALLALLPDCASACSCAILGNSPEERAKIALKESTAVFSGEVLDVEKGPLTRMLGFRTPSSRVTLRISEMWKGPQRETLEVSTPRDGASCGYSFSEGQKYLVYAYGKEEPFQTDLCSETKPLSKAGAHLQVLGGGQRLGDEPLPDTSGGVAGLGVLGLAAVAATTAAYLLLKRLLKS
jgi:hypothetical protein